MREILPTERGRTALEDVMVVPAVAAAAAAAVTHGIGDALLGGTAKASAAYAGEGPKIAHAVVARARYVKACKRWPRGPSWY